jgi:streptogramin lyase
VTPSSEAEGSNKGLGQGNAVPSWAVGKSVYFFAGEPTSPGASPDLGQRPGTDKPLLYHSSGSGVQHGPIVYPIFWGKNWESEPGAALKKQLLKMYEGLSGSSWQGISTQYFDSTGRISSTVSVASAWLDTSVTAPTSVNDKKLQEEVAAAVKAKGWTRTFSSQFVVMPAPGSTYEAGFDSGFCAYHGVDGSGSSYTFLPYLGEEPFKAGCVRFYDPAHENADNVDSMAATHEFAESTTDAGLNSWYTKNGWEIGDICASEGAAEEVTSGSLAGSWVQGQWDDHLSACTLADANPPHVYAVTEAATEVKSTTAKLNGTVNPEGLETKYKFEYGKTTSYGTSTSEVSAGSSVSNQAVSQTVSSLSPETTYHFRVVATNSTGTTNGEDKSIKTGVGPPENTSPPVASPTTPDQAVPESTTNGTWTNNPTSYAYQWERCNATGGGCENISGATQSTYTPAEADVTHTLRAKVTAKNAGGEGTATSNATNAVKPIGEITEYALPNSSGPVEITAGPDNHLWFTNWYSNKIGKITTSGTITEYSLPSGGRPIGITAGPDNNLWFTTETTSKIGKITTSGTITEYSLPSGSLPANITAGPDNNLWFTEFSTSKIGKITTSGTITEYSLPSESYPWGITAGPDGNLWFTEGHHIGKITTSGTITEYSVSSEGYPSRITAGPDGNLWFTIFTSYGVISEIGKITTSGTITQYSLPSGSAPLGITAGADGNLWFADFTSSKIGRITTSGTITEYSLPSSSGPEGITAGPDKNVWFTDYSTSKIGKITP